MYVVYFHFIFYTPLLKLQTVDGSTIADEVGKLRQFYMNLLRIFSMTLIQQNK